MKKKYLILPAAALVLSIFAGVFMLLFTTSFVCNYTMDRIYLASDEDPPEFDFNEWVNRSGKIAQIAYSIEPNYSNLEVVNRLYDARMVVVMSKYCEDGIKNALKDYPDDYSKKCVEYSKAYYEYMLNNYDKFYEYDHSPNKTLGVGHIDDESSVQLNACKNYILALYLNGQKEETRQLVEEIINDYEYYGVLATCEIYDYVDLVHSVETDKEFQDWMLEIELKSTQEYNKCTKAEKFENFYRDHEELGFYYKPFK